MLEVKVKGPAIKLQGQWKFKGEKAIITQEEYKENEKYLEVVKGKIERPQGNTKPENPEKPQGNNGDNGEDKELEELREKAKELGIRGAHNMKKENLIAKIEEVEKADNPDENEIEGEETSEDRTEGKQPEE